MANDGSITFDARLNTSEFQKEANTLGSIVKGLGIFAILQKGFQAVAGSMDMAISRYDALNKFPKVMEQMGYGADVAETSMNKLSDGIQGLPTTLDEIVQNTQQLTIATSSLETGTDSALALNNAFLASGASTSDATRGMQQYIQMLRTGKVDAVSWRTLQETMTYALQKTAEAFGFTGATAQKDLFDALKNSDITMTEFNAKLIELDGGLNGFAEVAKTATGGIGTAMTNLQSRTVIGVAAMVEAFDNGLSQTRFQSIENIINSASIGIRDALKATVPVIEAVASNLDVLGPIALTVAGAFAAYKILTPTIASFKAMTTAVTATKTALLASSGMVMGNVTSHTMLAAALSRETVAEKVRTAATKQGLTVDTAGNLVTAIGKEATDAQTASVLASSGALSAKTVIVALLSGQIGIVTAAQWLWNAAMTANPLGVVIAAVAALVAAIIGLTKWISKLNYANDEQAQKIDSLKEKQEELATSIEETTSSYEDNLAEVGKNQERSQNLLKTLSSLVDENGRLTGSHDDLTQVISDLNSQYSGLNLAYDEENGHLSANQQEIQKYIDAQNKRAELTVLQERRNSLLDEEAEIQASLREIEEQRNEINPNDDLIMFDGRAKKLRDLEKLEKEYTEQSADNAEKLQASNNAIKASNQAMIDSTIEMYESSGNAMTSDGVSIKKLAETYSTSTDQIIADMREQNISLDDWVANNQVAYTKNGKSIDQIAARWGMSNIQVKEQMELFGENLDEFAERMESSHTKAGLSVEQLAAKWGISVQEMQSQMDSNGLSLQEWSDAQDSGLQNVINGYKALPMKSELSLTQMTNILNKNAENMAKWKDNISQLSQVASQNVVDEMQRMGPASNAAVEEMLKSPQKLENYETAFSNAMGKAATEVENSSKNPVYNDYGDNMASGVSDGISNNEEISTAATQMVTNAETAANTAVANGNFTTVGQNIATQIVSGISSADMSGISTAISTAMKAGTTSATLELTSLQNAFKTQFTSIQKSTVLIVQQMMTSIVSAITVSRASVMSAATSVSNSFIDGIKEMPSRASSIANNAMQSMISSISSNQGQAYSSGYSIGKSTTDGMVAGLEAGKQNVYNKATEIANTAANKIKEALKIHSPSRVMMSIFGYVVDGMVLGLENNENALYSAISSLGNGVTSRIGNISTEMASAFNQKLAVAIDSNQLSLGRIPQVAAMGTNAANTTVINNYFEQTNISENAASPAESAREAEALMRRASWSIK